MKQLTEKKFKRMSLANQLGTLKDCLAPIGVSDDGDKLRRWFEISIGIAGNLEDQIADIKEIRARMEDVRVAIKDLEDVL